MKMGILSFLPPFLLPFFLGTILRLICSLHNPHTTDLTQENDELTQICKIIKHWSGESLFIWSYHGRTLYWAGWIVILALRKFCCHVMWKCLFFFSESVCLSLVKVSVFSESVFLLWVSVFLLLKCLFCESVCLQLKCLSFFSESVCFSSGT